MAALAEITVRFPGNPHLFERNRLDSHAGSRYEAVKLALRHSISAIVDNQCGFKVAGCGHSPLLELLDGFGKNRRVRFIQENC